MSYIPLHVVEDMTNPTDRMGLLSVQGLINALSLYATTATTYSKTEVDALIAARQATLGYVAENVVNKSTLVTLGTSDTLYPTQNAVKSYVDTQSALKENTANKSTTVTLGTSDVLFPTQNAVKSYVDTQSALKENVANKSTSTTLASASNTTYPSTLAVKTYIDTQDNLRELLSNKSTDGTFASSTNTSYPSTQAVKTYVDTQAALKENLSNKSTDATFASPNNTTYPTTQAVQTFVANAVKGNYQEITTNITMSAGMRYYVNAGAGNTLTLTLPTTFNQDDSFFIFGKTGSFKVAQQSGQTIRSVQGSTTTGSGGSITSTNQYATVTLRGLIASSEILVTTMQGVFNIV